MALTTREAINVMEKYTDETLSSVVVEAHKMAIKALKATGGVNATTEDCKAIVGHLNAVCGTRYRPSTPLTKRKISGRLSEGYTINDFFKVIDKKAAEWQGTDMEKFLTPDTLFGSKFEKYLNQIDNERSVADEWKDA